MSKESQTAVQGEVIRLRPLVEDLEAHQIFHLVRSRNVRISQVIIPAGQEVPTYEAEGEVILHCIQGHITVTALQTMHTLESGELLYLDINEPFSTRGIDNSTLLLIVLTPKQGPNVELIGK